MIETIGLFEGVVRVHPVDCLIDEGEVLFVVKGADLKRSLNRSGLEKLRRLLRRPVRVVAMDEDLLKFIGNYFRQNHPEDVRMVERKGRRTVEVQLPISQKSRAIGRGGRNLHILRELTERHFEFRDIIVI